MDKKRTYGVLDVMEELDIQKDKAYKIIRTLNSELNKKGYITIPGKVPRKYFEERCYL